MAMMLLLVLAAFAGGAESPVSSTCSVGELRRSPDYRYREERIRQFVDSASVIVRVKAVAAIPVIASPPTWPPTRIRFEVLERIRAPDSLQVVELRGKHVFRDDFNSLEVPYTMVRSAGQRGDCRAIEYRLEAEYLLLLQPGGYETLTPNWKPLAPFNEQVRGANDPWVTWVRQAARSQSERGSGAGLR
jgi:hypothetical protein